MSRARTKTKTAATATGPKKQNQHRLDAATSEPLLEGVDASLLDIVDHVLTKGIVVTGDLVLGVADIDLIYLRLSAVLCAADRILGKSPDAVHRRKRHAERAAAASINDPIGRPKLIAGKMGSPKLRTNGHR